MFKAKNKNKKEKITAKPKMQLQQQVKNKQSIVQQEVPVVDTCSELSKVNQEVTGHLDCALLRYTENNDLSYQKAMIDIISTDIPPMESNKSFINYACIIHAIRESNNHNVKKIKPKDFTESFKTPKTTGNEGIEVDIL